MHVDEGMMWNLGRIINTPEVSRVYMGSFWDKDYSNDENCKLFQNHTGELFSRIQDDARLDAVNKVEKIIQRAKLAKTHAHILCHVRGEIPYWLFWNRNSTQERLIRDLASEVQKVQVKSQDSLELLDVEKLKNQLGKYNMDFPTCDEAQGHFVLLVVCSLKILLRFGSS